MGIVSLKPNTDNINTNINTLPEAIQEPHKSIFTTLVPESRVLTLLDYVEGYPWTVDFFGQILNDNNSLQHFDPNIPNLTQPYYKVNKLILQVSSPLQTSYDSATAITSVSGSALTPYKIKPNAGDVFIAKVDNTEDAIFIINNVERKTFRKDTLYEISYTLYTYTSVNASFIDSLERRVQQTFFFNPDSNFFNRDVLLKPSVKEAMDRLEHFAFTSTKEYFDTFIQPIMGNLAIPGTLGRYIDPILINFILKTVNYTHNNLIKITTVDFSRYSMYNQKNIYDVILNRDKSILPDVSKKYRFIATLFLNNKVRLGTPMFINIDYVIAPYEIDISLNIANLDIYPLDPDTVAYPITKHNSNDYNRNIQTLTGTMPLLHGIYEDGYYVVSKNFYEYLETGRGSISYIEFLIYKFISNEAISKEDIAIAVEDVNKWSILHKLYLLPVLWLMINN